jgi:signal transduction histidine kinase
MPEPSRAELKYFVERQREEIKTLNEAGKLLSSTTDPQEILQLVASYLRRTFPIALSGIWLLEHSKLYLKPFAPLGQAELASAIRQIQTAAAELLHRPITEAESVPVVEQATDSAASWLPTTTSLRSHLFAPLIAKEQPIGLLGLFSGRDEAFTDEDRHTVGVIAEQCAAALRRAFLVHELHRADELKNQMLSIVSHELSTPLTAIKEGLSLILDGSLGPTSPDQQDFLKTVLENTERLEQLTQKVKTTTEIMTGQTQFTLESFDLRSLVANVEKTYRQMAASRGVHLKLIEYPKPLFWPTDPAHTTLALSQLVENAIQATPRDGFVTLKLSATPNEVEIQLLDTGCGIAKEALPTLFDQFKSIGDIHDRKMGGLGQGLFIARSLIEGQGGTISAESVVGQGTQMTVRLPKQAETARTAQAGSA